MDGEKRATFFLLRRPSKSHFFYNFQGCSKPFPAPHATRSRRLRHREQVDKEKSKIAHNKTMTKKIRELIQDLVEAGFYEIKGTGKGSHKKYTHALYPGAVTISGKSGEDSKRYQEKQVLQAIEEVKK